MAKYKIKESQLEAIMEHLLTEDTLHPDDPANNRVEPNIRHNNAMQADGPFSLLDYDGKEYLLINTQSKEIFYTIADAFDGDIYTAMHDYLSIPQEPYSDEDGTRDVNADDWEHGITDDDLAKAIPHYMNHMYKNNMLDVSVDAMSWESGKGQFLLITKDLATHADLSHLVYSDKLIGDIKQRFAPTV